MNYYVNPDNTAMSASASRNRATSRSSEACAAFAGAVSATANPQHAAELLDVARFRLADADMAVLSGLT